MNLRHRARRLALQGLCCLDSQGPDAMDLAVEFITDSRESNETIELAVRICTGSYALADDSDEILTRHTRDWNLQRLALVDRNILRLAVWELLTKNAPPKVAIVEAIRLAKEFSTAESPRFINGVLDAVAKDISGGNKGNLDAPGKKIKSDADGAADEAGEAETAKPDAAEPQTDPVADAEPETQSPDEM